MLKVRSHPWYASVPMCPLLKVPVELLYGMMPMGYCTGAQSCVRDCTCIQDELAAAWVLALRGARLTSICLTHASWTGAEQVAVQPSAESLQPQAAIRLPQLVRLLTLVTGAAERVCSLSPIVRLRLAGRASHGGGLG